MIFYFCPWVWLNNTCDTFGNWYHMAPWYFIFHPQRYYYKYKIIILSYNYQCKMNLKGTVKVYNFALLANCRIPYLHKMKRVKFCILVSILVYELIKGLWLVLLLWAHDPLRGLAFLWGSLWAQSPWSHPPSDGSASPSS